MIRVLTLSWNGLGFLNKLRDGLFRNLDKTGCPYEWYIRSNGCTDGTPDEAIRWENTKVLAKNHNRDSFSKGVNSLFDLASPDDSDIILLLNNDIEFISDNNIKMMISLLKDNAAGMIGSKLYNEDKTISHYGIVISHKYGNLPWNFKSGQKSTKYDSYDRKFQAVTAACCVLTSKIFKKVNKLNEDYNWCFEDVDLCLKISINENMPIFCCGNTNIIHQTSASLKKNPVNKLFMSHNVNVFKRNWGNKCIIDHQLYLNNPKYGLAI